MLRGVAGLARRLKRFRYIFCICPVCSVLGTSESYAIWHMKKISQKQYGIVIAKHPNVLSCLSSPLQFHYSPLDKDWTLMLKLYSLQFPQEAGEFNTNENMLWLTLSKHETTGLQTNFELPERRGIFPDSIEKYDRRYWTWSKLLIL